MNDRAERFAAAALERGLITPEQLEECRRIHATVAEVGIDQPLEEILVKKGYLTPEKARQLSRELSVMRVGKYQILEKLGEGGAGIVYKANQEPLERVVAVKVLAKRRAGDERYVERFLREARVAVTLNHRNIVRGLDYGEADGYHYFVMEYVEGESLYNILKREGTFDERRALTIALQVVAALSHAAQYDLVHRDIKPENILLTPDGTAKLCDLGLAKPSLVETAKASRDGTTIGTPTYMSPEQIRGKDETDFRADVYSLGATLYHMTTGRPPFTGESADVIVRKHLRDPLIDPREHNLKLSAGAAAVITKMLAKQPDDRYGSLSALAEDLQSLIDGRPPSHAIQIGAKPVAPPKLKAEDAAVRRVRQEERRRTPVALILLVVMLLGGGVAAAFLLGGKGGESPSRVGTGTGGASVTPADEPGGAPEEDAAAAAAARAEAERIALANRREAEAARARIQAAVDAVVLRAQAMEAEGRYGDAIAVLRPPAEATDPEFQVRLDGERRRIADAAAARRDAVFLAADEEVKAGRHAAAAKLLDALGETGISEIDQAVRNKIAAIRRAEEEERSARARGRQALMTEIGAAFQLAAEGKWSEAESAVVKAGGRPELGPFGVELNQAFRDLRAAKAYEEAIRAGVEKATGATEQLALLLAGRPSVTGRIAGAAPGGVRLSRGAIEETIPFSALAPDDRRRFASLSFPSNQAENHLGGAFYFLAHGFLDDAKSEIRAAEVLGGDVRSAEATSALMAEFLAGQADADLARAEAARADGRTKEALALVEKVVARSPWYGRAHGLYGQLLVAAGRFDEGIAELARAAEMGHADPILAYHQGLAFHALGRTPEAMQAFERFLAASAGGPDQIEKARTLLDEMKAAIAARRVKELVGLAEEAMRRKRFAEAAGWYEELNTLSPNAEEAEFHLGRCYLELGRILPAFAHLNRYVELVPAGKRTADAKRLLTKLQADHREHPEGLGLLDQANRASTNGKLEQALDLFGRAGERIPLNPDVWYGRVIAVLNHGGRKPELLQAALEDLDRMAALTPDAARLYEARSQVLYEMERYEEAAKVAAEATARGPERSLAWTLLVLSRMAGGKWAEAVEPLDQAVTRFPDDPSFRIHRARTFIALERLEEAAADLTAAEGKITSAAQRTEIAELRKSIAEAGGNR